MADADGRAAGTAFTQLLRQERLVAVLRSSTTEHYETVVEHLISGGIQVIELTLTAVDPLEALRRLGDRFGDRAVFGMGTVLTRAHALAAIDAGSHYLVTPLLVRDVIEIAHDHGVPVLSGALTPTEIFEAVTRGADGVKVFPASAVGPRYFREIAGPLPGLTLMPSGGVGVDDIGAWLAAGSAAVSLGGSLIGRSLEGDLDGLDARIDAAVRAAHGDVRP